MIHQTLIDQIYALDEFAELVRGNEQHLVEHFQALVSREDVILDFENVARIDAAGIAALVTLYCDACKAGHRFAIANPSPHVREILALVGLDALLVSRNTEDVPYLKTQLQQAAA